MANLNPLTYIISDWYWVVGDTNPTTQVFSSLSQAFVANNAAAYLTWLAASNAGYAQTVLTMTGNGGGKVQLTVDTTINLQTGQYWYFIGLTGTPAANGAQQITVINSTTLDIVAIPFVAATLDATAQLQGSTIIDTAAHLNSILNVSSLAGYVSGATSSTGTTTLTLTNPLAQKTVRINTSTSATDIVLPTMNAYNSPYIGIPFFIVNDITSTGGVNIFKKDGTTLPFSPTSFLLPGEVMELTLMDNSTANGTFTGLIRNVLDLGYVSSVRGLVAFNNTGTPNTKMDITFYEVASRHRGGSTNRVVTNGLTTYTVDAGAAGPVAGGRDQSGAFSASQWLHVYFISKGVVGTSVGTNVLISSVGPNISGFTGAPVLPTDYLYSAYLFSVYWDGSSHLLPVHVLGDTVYYDTFITGLSGGTATGETAVSLATSVPPAASKMLLESVFTAQSTAGAIAIGIIRFLTTKDSIYHYNTSVAGYINNIALAFELPNVAQQFYYILTDLAGTNDLQRKMTVYVRGYSVPNGDN